jgi:hypothetical protein
MLPKHDGRGYAAFEVKVILDSCCHLTGKYLKQGAIPAFSAIQ